MPDGKAWDTPPTTPHDVRQLLEDAAKLQAKLDAANREIGRLQSELRIAKQLQNRCCECGDYDSEVCCECWQRDKWVAK